MRIFQRHTLTTSLLLVLTIIWVLTSISTSGATRYDETVYVATVAYAEEELVELNHSVTIVGLISAGRTLPVFDDIEFQITLPDESKEILGPYESNSSGYTITEYSPPMAGNYSVYLRWYGAIKWNINWYPFTAYGDTFKVIEKPVASFTCSHTTQLVNERIDFDASDSTDSDGTIVNYVWDFGDGNTETSMKTSHSYNSDGTYMVNLTVTDNDGLTANDTKEIIIYKLGEPVASFTCSHTTQLVNERIDFDASDSTDSDGTIVNYVWDFGDGNTETGMTTSHSYSLNGTYTVTLTVRDNDGLTGNETKIITVNRSGSEIIDDEDPVANAGNSRTVNAGSTVPFSAAGSSDNVGIVSYEWNFGDGNSGTGETVSHTYGEAGNYTVSLTVKDAAGNSDAVTIVITVEEAAFPFWILIPIVIVIFAVILVWFFFIKKRQHREKASKPTKIRVTVDPNELLADGKSKSSIIIELLDKDGNPVPADSDTEIQLKTTMGKIEKPLTKIPKGKNKVQSILVSSKKAGYATLSAEAKGLKGTTITITFKEKARYCMHCGSKMPFATKKCPICNKFPPSGVDTILCQNCGTVVPSVAKFCADCGARQEK